jgi:glutaredoxin
MSIKKIILFSHDGCKECKELKEELHKEEIPYRVINVLEQRNIWELIQQEEDNIKFTPTLCIESPKEGLREFLAAGRDFNNTPEGITKLKNLL